MLTEVEREFLHGQRVAHLATADSEGTPHVIPICFVAEGDCVYFTIDEKPKTGAPLKRLSNIRANPSVAVVVDHYEEDWSRLGWLMLQGRAEILDRGGEHDRAQANLRARYRQLDAMRIEGLPVVAIRVERTASWGNLQSTHRE